jgi:hypothetical protein
MWDRDLGLDAIHREEHRPCSIEQSRARISQSNATPVPDEEWRAKLLLKKQHLTAESRLRHTHFRGRVCESALGRMLMK